MTERVKLILDAYKSRKSARAIMKRLEEIAEVIYRRNGAAHELGQLHAKADADL